MQYELELARREIAVLRMEAGQHGPRLAAVPAPQVNIRMISELLDIFDGMKDTYETWEQELKHLREIYTLDEANVKVLIRFKVRDKAAEWLHSKPEYLRGTADELLSEMKKMFCQPSSKRERRKLCEDRTWKRTETFSQYLHAKIILANRVPIEEDEMLDYIIDGIPDENLRNQARLADHQSIEHLQKVFCKIDRQSSTNAPSYTTKRDHARPWAEKSTANTSSRAEPSAEIRCFGCDQRGHRRSECPSRKRCFNCNLSGHIAVECPKTKANIREINKVDNYNLATKTIKSVNIDNREVLALIDTGADVSLMRKSVYVDIGASNLTYSDLEYVGVGSDNLNKTLGKCEVVLKVDDNKYNCIFHVVPDCASRHNVIVGNDFLDTVRLVREKNLVHISKLEHEKIPEIYSINILENQVDTSHIINKEYKGQVENLVANYRPMKTREIGVEMKLILSDDIPVYQRARKLSFEEKRKGA